MKNEQNPYDADATEVMVGWLGHPELGRLECTVTQRWEHGGAKFVRWCGGEEARVVYCHSRASYLFMRDPRRFDGRLNDKGEYIGTMPTVADIAAFESREQ